MQILHESFEIHFSYYIGTDMEKSNLEEIYKFFFLF